MSLIQVAYFGLFDVIMQWTSPLRPGMCRRMKCGFLCTKSLHNCDVIHCGKVLRCLHIAVTPTTLLLTVHCAVACRQTPWLVNYNTTLVYLLTVACLFPSADCCYKTLTWNLKCNCYIHCMSARQSKTFQVPSLNMMRKNLILTAVHWTKIVDPNSQQSGMTASATLPAILWNDLNETWY